MDTQHLTANEWTAYQAGCAASNAARWRIDAEMLEREGKDGSQCRKYEADAKAEHDRLLSILAKRKEIA